MEKKFPIRTCIACHNKRNKHELIRIVKTISGENKVDLIGKHEGRGAYICPRIECLERLLKQKRHNKLFNVEEKEVFFQELKEAMESRN